MNDHTLPVSAARSLPLVPGLLRHGAAATAALLFVLCLFLAGRRFGGAFDQPLNPPLMLALGLGMAVLAGCLRAAWPRAAHPPGSLSSRARLLLPSLDVFLFCYALSLPGSAPWAVGLLWFLAVSLEGAWWLTNSLALAVDRQRPAARPLASAADDTGPPVDLARDVAEVTQQITRLRDEDGRDLVFGQARAAFVSGERSQIIHLAFCPPLADKPKMTVSHASGAQATLTVAQAEPFGARIDVRLAATARQPESVMIEFEARSEMVRSEPAKADS